MKRSMLVAMLALSALPASGQVKTHYDRFHDATSISATADVYDDPEISSLIRLTLLRPIDLEVTMYCAGQVDKCPMSEKSTLVLVHLIFNTKSWTLDHAQQALLLADKKLLRTSDFHYSGSVNEASDLFESVTFRVPVTAFVKMAFSRDFAIQVSPWEFDVSAYERAELRALAAHLDPDPAPPGAREAERSAIIPYPVKLLGKAQAFSVRVISKEGGRVGIGINDDPVLWEELTPAGGRTVSATKAVRIRAENVADLVVFVNEKLVRAPIGAGIDFEAE